MPCSRYSAIPRPHWSAGVAVPSRMSQRSRRHVLRVAALCSRCSLPRAWRGSLPSRRQTYISSRRRSRSRTRCQAARVTPDDVVYAWDQERRIVIWRRRNTERAASASCGPPPGRDLRQVAREGQVAGRVNFVQGDFWTRISHRHMSSRCGVVEQLNMQIEAKLRRERLRGPAWSPTVPHRDLTEDRKVGWRTKIVPLDDSAA